MSDRSTLLGEVFFAFAKGADTPVSLACWLMFKYGEHSQLAKKSIDPLQYNDLDHFDRDYAVVKYLSKYKDLDTGIDLDGVALESWKQAEFQCAKTNERIRMHRQRGSSPRVEAVLFTAQRKIAGALGPLRLVKALEGCRWGPGATFSLKGERANLVDKMREYPLSVTKKARWYFQKVVEADPHWSEVILGSDVDGPYCLLPSAFKEVEGCRATLVDKSAKTKRSIAIEPTGNIFLQLGIGRYIRGRLRRVGVDLDDQTRNQSLAWLGSFWYDSIATLDLASASDTVSRELVYQLLPLDWAELLESCRSPKISWMKGSWTNLEKFSSMGNGFTFELESLIFWSLASAVAEVLGRVEIVGIYGDDIAVEPECVPLLREVLEFCGFSINLEKSYELGHFRESCGKHYWQGVDVTPPYQKEPPSSLPEAYRMCNRLYRYSLHRDNGIPVRVRRPWVRTSWLRGREGLLALLQGGRRQFSRGLAGEWIERFALLRGHGIPITDDGDDGLLLPMRELRFLVRREDQDGRLFLPILSFRSKTIHVDERALLAYWLRFGSESPFGGRLAVRRRGKYVSRRRWFSNAFFVSSPSALDVALA